MARRERRDESGENDAHSIEIKFTLFIYIHRTNDFRNDDCAKAIVSNAKETAQLFVNYWITLRHVSTCGQSRRRSTQSNRPRAGLSRFVVDTGRSRKCVFCSDIRRSCQSL